MKLIGPFSPAAYYVRDRLSIAEGKLTASKDRKPKDTKETELKQVTNPSDVLSIIKKHGGLADEAAKKIQSAINREYEYVSYDKVEFLATELLNYLAEIINPKDGLMCTSTELIMALAQVTNKVFESVRMAKVIEKMMDNQKAAGKKEPESNEEKAYLDKLKKEKDKDPPMYG